MIDFVTFIIRSANERTESLCKKLILDEGVNNENLFIVREVPFSAAMIKSFEIGISKRLPWTFCIDADVLLRPGSIEYMLDVADNQKNNVCEIQGMMLDKFFGGPRPGGIHLYRTSLLPEVIKRIPREGIDIRPEHYTLNKMNDDGYPWKKIPYVVGIHDDEQYNFDIYRKCYVHGIKHIQFAHLFIEIWKYNMKSDSDYQVALRAFADSILNNESIFINKNQLIYRRLFDKSGIIEKPELGLESFSLERIESIIQNWKEPEIYMKKFPTRWGLDKPRNIEKTKNIIKEHGLIRAFPILLGKIILGIGSRRI